MPRKTSLLASLVLLTFSLGLNAAENEFVEGTHYMKLDEPRETRAAEDEIEVIEFFWYGCPHCYAAEPHIEKWLQDKPDDVRFLRVPATLNRGWLPLARAYYAAEQLGIIREMHPVLFRTIHEQRNQLRSVDDVARVFKEEAGISREQFDGAFQGFAVGMKLKQADELARSYPLSGVPSIVVGGKYLTTAGMAGSYKAMIDLTRELTEKVREERNEGGEDSA